MQSRPNQIVLGIRVSVDASQEDVQIIRMATINVLVLILFFTLWIVIALSNGSNPYLGGVNIATLVGIVGCFIGGFVQKQPQFLKSLSCCTFYMVFNITVSVIGSALVWSQRELQCRRCIERNLTQCIIQDDNSESKIVLHTSTSCKDYKMSNDPGTMLWLAFCIVHIFLFAGAGFFVSKLSSMSHFAKCEESLDDQPKPSTPIPVLSSSMVHVQPNLSTTDSDSIHANSHALNVSFT